MEAPFKTRDASKPRGATIILFLSQAPKATHTLPHPHVKKPEKGEVRLSTPHHPHAGAEQRLYSEWQGQINKQLSHSQRWRQVRAPADLRVWSTAGRTWMQSHEYTHSHTGFYKSAPTPTASLLTHRPSASCPLRRCHHHTLFPRESAERWGILAGIPGNVIP